MRGIALSITLLLLHFIFNESKICPRCKIPAYENTTQPLFEAPQDHLDISACLYPASGVHEKLNDLSRLPTPVCLYIIPLRDDALEFYFPPSDDAYFTTFWEENGERCLKYYNNEVVGFYNLKKYGNLPTDVLFSCGRGFVKQTDDAANQDTLDKYLSTLMLAFIQQMEGKPKSRLMRCYDRDSDLANSHFTLHTCMLAVVNRIFAVGPLSFNSFFVDHVDDSSADFSSLSKTFLSAQGRQEGCALADADSDGSIFVYPKKSTSSKYLLDGQCTGTLNLDGFNLLCCCYEEPQNCLYTASPPFFNIGNNRTDDDNFHLVDNQFMCIKGFLSDDSPELKFTGNRADILTDLAPHCYTEFIINYDKNSTFNVSLSFGAALGDSICDSSDDGNIFANSYQYLKSPWGFHSQYNVKTESINIVRCCKGHFCNHFGMFGDENAYAWPTQFRYQMNVDWEMKCGYLPVDIFWNIFKQRNAAHECTRAISEDKTAEIQSFLGGRDLVAQPLHEAMKKANANFSGILPNDEEPMFCFYAGVPTSVSMERSGIAYKERVVFGCQVNETFTIEFNEVENFNVQSNLHHQNALRLLRNQYEPYSTCLSTMGASVEILSFLQLQEKEKLTRSPGCFAMIYKDFHTTFYRAGPCSNSESCCTDVSWKEEYYNATTHIKVNGRKRGQPWKKNTTLTYKCNSPWCMSEEMNARCFFYAGREYTAIELIETLHHINDTNSMYPSQRERAQVSLTVDSLKGYDPETFKEMARVRNITSVDTGCAADNKCFDETSVFHTSNIASALPFCSWSPQRQRGADYSREVMVADSSSDPNRVRFELDCKYDYGSSTQSKKGGQTDESSTPAGNHDEF